MVHQCLAATQNHGTTDRHTLNLSNERVRDRFHLKLAVWIAFHLCSVFSSRMAKPEFGLCYSLRVPASHFQLLADLTGQNR